MNIKRFVSALILLISFSANSAFASILGNPTWDYESYDIGKGVVLYKNTFLSEQKGVGNQTEFYSVYTPNQDVIPIVLTGDKIYGKRTAKQIAEYMYQNDMTPVLGINASYFSFQTGIPSGHVITNGVVTSKDIRTLPAVGFYKDGTAFISELNINTTAYYGDGLYLQIPNINKFITKGVNVPTLFTSDFAEYTGTDVETLNIVLSNISDNVRIGSYFTATVEEVFTTKEKVKIEKDKYILSVSTAGTELALSRMKEMKVGDTIKFSTTANEDRWRYVYNSMASDGARMLKNGNVCSGLDSSAAPRSCVGVKSNGDTVFYALDGRQNGYSYGAKLQTVAKRLKEMGCVEAINLDGGGSTTFLAVYPGDTSASIVNSPSEKSLRAVTNFLILQNVAEKTGIASKLYFYPTKIRALTGCTVDFSLKATDENYYAAELPADITIESDEKSTVLSNSKIRINSEGNTVITATSQTASGSITYQGISNPDSVKAYDKSNNKELNMTDVLPGDSFSFLCYAYKDSSQITATQDLFKISVEDTAYIELDEAQRSIKILKGFSKPTELKITAGNKTTAYTISLGSRADGDEFFPKINIEKTDNTIRIKTECTADIVDLDNTEIKIDGKNIALNDCEVEETEKGYIITYTNAKDFGKVFVKSASKSGFIGIKAYSNPNFEVNNDFCDIQNHWAKNIISYMSKVNIASGSEKKGNWYFNPDNNITREEFCVLCVKLLRLNPQDYSNISVEGFNDKAEIAKWSENYIKTAYSNKIINGKTQNGKLYIKPKDNITREEAFAIISRLLPEKIQMKNISYKDNNSISAWAYDAVKKLCTNGFVNGYSDGTVKPQNKISRAEAISLLYNIF